MNRTEVATRRMKRLWIALGLNAAIVAAQLVAGFAAHSLGLLADAGHNFTDVTAVAISMIAVQWSMRRPTDRRSYGYHRGTILAALTNSLSILAITVFMAFEAIRRLIHPQPVRGGIVIVVALAAALVNGVAALVLHEHHAANEPGDLNMRSALLHMTSDAVISVAVAATGAVILVTGGYDWLDPAISLVIGVLIAIQAIKLLRQAVDVLLESTPSDVDVQHLVTFVAALPGVEAAHDVHVWSLSSEVRALSAHLLLEGEPTLAQAQVVGDRVKAALRDQFAIAHATLELETEHCNHGDPDCIMDEPLVPGHAHDHGN